MTVSITKLKTGNPFEDKESFSRIVAIDDWLFTSNTAGRNLKTKIMPDTAEGQAAQAFENIDAALRAVGSSLSDVVRSRITVPNPADVPAVMRVVAERFRGIDPVSTVTCAALATSHLKFEIELTAYRGASALKQQRMIIAL